MLRRVEKKVSLRVGWYGEYDTQSFFKIFPGYLFVVIGGKESRTSDKSWSESKFQRLKKNLASFPEKVLRKDEKTLWGFQGRWYWDNEGLSADEVFAVLTARAARAKNSIDRAKSIAGFVATPVTGNRRGHISPDLRQLVWLRDNGACTNCGSNIELQFDHIIPVAMGGATNEENLQILCGSCNRTKGNSVG
jgi:hypothetical protein